VSDRSRISIVEHSDHQATSVSSPKYRHGTQSTVTPRDARAVSRVSDDAEAAFDPMLFRQVLGHFCTGVTIVTAVQDTQPIGLTIQSFTSVSLVPPLVSICPAKSSSSWPRIKASGAFCVNILRDDQEVISRAFATKARDRFSNIDWRQAPGTGSPLLDGALAWVDCRFQAEHDAGDHVIAVGRVVGLGTLRQGWPLLFYQGGYGHFEATHAGCTSSVDSTCPLVLRDEGTR
jgi:3-hydroxy-9,10-secoandrosta-1,3,5(10)-triene-9,17-dione monooxygenase reductase component